MSRMQFKNLTCQLSQISWQCNFHVDQRCPMPKLKMLQEFGWSHHLFWNDIICYLVLKGHPKLSLITQCATQMVNQSPLSKKNWAASVKFVKVSISMYCIFCICKWTSLPRLTLQPWWLVETLGWGPLECYTGAPHKISIYLFIILSTS